MIPQPALLEITGWLPPLSDISNSVEVTAHSTSKESERAEQWRVTLLEEGALISLIRACSRLPPFVGPAFLWPLIPSIKT